MVLMSGRGSGLEPRAKGVEGGYLSKIQATGYLHTHTHALTRKTDSHTHKYINTGTQCALNRHTHTRTHTRGQADAQPHTGRICAYANIPSHTHAYAKTQDRKSVV